MDLEYLSRYIYEKEEMKVSYYYSYLTLGYIFFACQPSADLDSNQLSSASQHINAEGLSEHIQVLASDDFQGRLPFTLGEEKTVNYIEEQFKSLGLQPGNGNSFFQEVPLVEITSQVTGDLILANAQDSISIKPIYGDEFVALTRRVQENIVVAGSPLVFAGYGIVAPEYNWNDYEGIDVKGKTVVVMVNDPGYGSDDNSFFKGNTMTYYGRWTYKYEEAARQGATGVLIVHDTGPAGYPWGVVKGGWSGPNQYMKAADNNQSRCAFEGWLSLEATKKMLKFAQVDTTILDRAKAPGFKSEPLNNLKVWLELSNQTKEDVSRNVVGLYPGTDRPDEYIIYTGHWDHLGIGEAVNGDSIYNGAQDNASGIAAMIEIAEAFSIAEEKPKRSIVFLAVTAEEQGLLGSAYYAANPIYPPKETVANINMDALATFGATKDLIVVGYGQSELDEYAEAAAKKQDRYIVPDLEPEKGFFFRSDHFNFAKIGIPALYAEGGFDSREHGKEWGQEQKDKFTNDNYHQASDEFDPSWDLSGMVEDSQLFFEVGYQLSREDIFPKWKEGSEFKAARDE